MSTHKKDHLPHHPKARAAAKHDDKCDDVVPDSPDIAYPIVVISGDHDAAAIAHIANTMGSPVKDGKGKEYRVVKVILERV